MRNWQLLYLVEVGKRFEEKESKHCETINKIKRVLPSSARTIQNRRYSSSLWKNADIATLTMYQRKPKKNVCILCSLRLFIGIDSTEKKKLETIIFYNKTKWGVDVVDQMARQYSVKGGTCRWPVVAFLQHVGLDVCQCLCIMCRENRKRNFKRKFVVINVTVWFVENAEQLN